MVELGLHLGRRAFPVDGRMNFTTYSFVFMNVFLVGVHKKGPARKREDKDESKRRNCLMEVEE